MSIWYESQLWLKSPRHIVSAAIVATDARERLLLVCTPLRGWEMPGGQVENGESLDAAAIRETREESGIEVSGLVFCGIFHSLDRSIVNVLFRGECSGGELKTSDETLEVGFFEIPTALAMIQHANFRERVEFCLDRARHPFYVVF